MPDFRFSIVGALGVPQSATPLLALRLKVEELSGQRIESLSLNCQIRIDAARRRYSPQEQGGLLDLFGEITRWGTTLKSLLWTHVNLVIPPFEGEREVDVVIQCSTDLCVAAARYFRALEDGTVPLEIYFSGMCFHRDDTGALQVAPIPWTAEAHYGLPVSTWRGLIDEHYGDVSWLLLTKETADALHRWRGQQGLPTFDGAIEQLMVKAGAVGPEGVAR